jgi:AraC-like DNA-binding protein
MISISIIRAAYLAPVLAELREKGVAVEAELARSSLPTGIAGQPEVWLSLYPATAFLQRMAATQRIEALGMSGPDLRYALQRTTTLKDALAYFFQLATPHGRPAPTEWSLPAPISEHLITALMKLLPPYLEDNYPSIELAATIAGTSVRTLQRQLASCGATYSGLIRRARFDTAVALLRKPATRMIDVAFAVGYEDPSSFARAFRQFASASPRVYRKQLLAA